MTTKMTDLVTRFLTWPVPADVYPECTCAAKDMTFGRCCKVTPNAEVTGA